MKRVHKTYFIAIDDIILLNRIIRTKNDRLISEISDYSLLNRDTNYTRYTQDLIYIRKTCDCKDIPSE